MRVSVVVYTSDRPDDLIGCLEAVRSQSLQGFELIVVDNGVQSPVADEQIRPGRVVRFAPKHLPLIFDAGWRAATGDVVAMLADDVRPDPGWLAGIVDVLNSRPDVSAVGGPIVSTSQPGSEIERMFALMRSHRILRPVANLYEWLVYRGDAAAAGRLYPTGAYTFGASATSSRTLPPHEVDLLTTSSMAVRRSVLEQLDGFDSRYWFNHADGDLFVRMQELGGRLWFDPRVAAVHSVRMGPSRDPYIIGRDTAVFLGEHARPRTARDSVGAVANVAGMMIYWLYVAVRYGRPRQLRGPLGLAVGTWEEIRARQGRPYHDPPSRPPPTRQE